MTPEIKRTYPKEKVRKVGEGYTNRIQEPFQSIIIHTTNGRIGSSFASEASFLQYSKNVGAHYLIGKEGQIEQILDLFYAAYHAGTVIKAKYSNKRSIGIEVHFTPGEGSWTVQQWESLTYLVSRKLPNIELATHRYIAYPVGRKIDPSGVDNNMFNVWKNNIWRDWVIIETKFNSNYRSSPLIANNVIRVVSPGQQFLAFKVTGMPVGNNSNWYCTPEGFLHESVVKEVHDARNITH